jgi:sugar lactone lactonase YvrE
MPRPSGIAGRGAGRILASEVNAMDVQHVLAARARLGECPLWNPARQRLDWVDVYNHRVHEFDPATRDDRHVDAGDVVSAVALTDDDRLLIALRDRLALLEVASGTVETLHRFQFSRPDTRLNDGKCDARGRFWVGSISQTPGDAALYCYDRGSLKVMETGLTISNGLGWSPDGERFYLTDSPKRQIYVYRFDAERGAIRDRRVLVDLSGEACEPDGLAVDDRGHLWSALWNGWSIVCFDTEGRELGRARLPVQRPTSVAFGGPDLADLYVTSASVGLSQTEIQQGIRAGDLFRLSTGSHGLPPRRFRT